MRAATAGANKLVQFGEIMTKSEFIRSSTRTETENLFVARNQIDGAALKRSHIQAIL